MILFALVVLKALHGFAVCRIHFALLNDPFRIGRTQSPARLRRLGSFSNGRFGKQACHAPIEKAPSTSC
jgi:hypothetical protein